MAFGLMVLRVVFGVVIAAHGAQKLFGWLGGYGIAGTGGFFESLGFRPGKLFAVAAGIAEFGGGILMVLGLLGPIGPALVISTMIVAAATVHWGKGLFAPNGIELTLLYAAAAAALALTGPGALSLDAAIGLEWPAAINAIVLAAGIAGGVANLFLRRPAAQASQELKEAA